MVQGFSLDFDGSRAVLRGPQAPRRLICAAEVGQSRLHDHIVPLVHVEPQLLHLSARLPLALRGTGAILVGLGLVALRVVCMYTSHWAC